jgi:selenocysteine lyase/cysteine desulfurase
LDYVFAQLAPQTNIVVLAPQHQQRLGVVSFYIEDLHFNLGVKLLNDRFGIQMRGGCSCAGTYGHYLLNVDQELSSALVCQIDAGNLIQKPGWIRMSFHPTTTNAEIELVCNSVLALAQNHTEWAKDYVYETKSNEFVHRNFESSANQMVHDWFEL